MEVAQRPFCDWVQMMENSQLKLLFEISLFIRANNPFTMPISLNMDNIKKAAQLNYETHWRWSVCYNCVHMQYSWVRCSDVAGIQSKADYYLKNRTGNWLSVTDIWCAFKTEGLFKNSMCCMECECDFGCFIWLRFWIDNIFYRM